jgi:two-component system, OmpR family, sensor kinase
VSFRLRLTLFGAGVVALTVLAFGWLVYQLAAHTQGSDQDRVLSRRAAEAVAAVPAAPGDMSPSLAAAEDLRRHSDVFVEVLGPSGIPLSTTARIGDAAPMVPMDVLSQALRKGGVLATVDESGIPVRVSIRPWTGPDAGLGGFVLAGQPISVQSTNLNGLRAFLIISAIPALLAALGASWLVTGRALRPLRAVAQTAQAIGRTRDLQQRLPQREGKDELSQLSQSFNQMLAQLQQAHQQLAAALEAQRRFVADASHELRTPLTTIRGNAGLLAFGPSVTDDVRAAAARDIASESERMSRLVEQLLTLAQADAGQDLQVGPLALRPILEAVCRQAQVAHPDRQFRCTGLTEVQVAGDEDALTQLLWIMVDNAVKFTKADGQIEIGLVQQNGAARLTVADDGIGIPPADLERIFDRFYRVDPSRSGAGAGIGLSIARWIAGQHQGTVTARNNEGPGSTLTVQLPLTV